MMSPFRGLPFRSLACLLLLAGVVSVFAPAQAQAEEDRTAQVEALFREGVDLFQQGHFAEAQQKFRRVLELEPRKELAARLVDECGTAMMAKMMAEPRMGAEPTRIWELYRKYYIGKLNDAQSIQKMAARVVDPATSEDERARLYREFVELGHYGVSALAPYLNDAQHKDFQAHARVVLARMGQKATLPLIELLGHKSELMRQNAILTLTDIMPRDDRPIAALKARLEDEKELDSTKRYATRALELITGLRAENLKTAAEYYYDAANRYYLERAGVVDEAEMVDGYIWHLNEAGDLVAVLFPIWSWNEQMAEEQVLRGMALQNDKRDFYPLAACIYAAQFTEVESLVEVISEAPSRHFFSEEEKNTLQVWKDKLVDCKNLAAACGKYYVNEALWKTLWDMKRYKAHPRLPEVAVFLCRILRYLDPEGELLDAPPAPAPAPVVAEAPPSPPVATTIDIIPPHANVPPFGTQQFKAVTKDQYGKVMSGIKYLWESKQVEGEESGAKIDGTGFFTAGSKKGRYDISAKADLPAEEKAPGAEGKAEAKAEAPAEPGATPTRPSEPSQFRPEPTELNTRSALVGAMYSENQNVQYAGALALAGINKFPVAWFGSEKVATLLGRGVSENKPIQILVVEEDQNVRNELRAALEALGYGVTDAVNGRDGMVKAREFPPKDVIVASDRLRSDLTPEQLIEELRGVVYTRYVPVGILHNTVNRNATQARFGAETALVEREAKADDLKKQIEDLAAKRQAEQIPKKHAHEIARSCAEALSALHLNCTSILLADAVPDANNALINRPDDIRVPAAVFLGNAKGGAIKEEVATRLREVFLNKENAVPMRLAALKSLGEVKPEAYQDDYLKAQLDEKEWELQFRSAINFGLHERQNKELYQFLREKRVEREKKEK